MASRIELEEVRFVGALAAPVRTGHLCNWLNTHPFVLAIPEVIRLIAIALRRREGPIVSLYVAVHSLETPLAEGRKTPHLVTIVRMT